MASTDKTRFFQLLDNYPTLSRYWDREADELKVKAFENATGLSGGETLVLNVLASIWFGSGRGKFEIDITDLAALSVEARRPVLEWLADPFWP
jgi:hypothetical protein